MLCLSYAHQIVNLNSGVGSFKKKKMLGLSYAKFTWDRTMHTAVFPLHCEKEKSEEERNNGFAVVCTVVFQER